MHTSVLLHESVEGLHLKQGDTAIDGTTGLGGHTEAIVNSIGATGTLLALDLDEDALQKAKTRLAYTSAEVRFREASFRDISAIVREEGLKHVHGILFDLGWNATQLESGRGFSFLSDDPLIMTYLKHPAAEETAAAIVNEWSEHDLAEVIATLGEERYASRIAEAIVARRGVSPIKTAKDLAEIVASAVPRWYRAGRIHPATKTFQALRMLVNGELSAIESGVRGALEVLEGGGRLAIITFHSLEDGLVKRLFKAAEKAGGGKIITKKPIVPPREEIRANPRSRSAKLRIFEKYGT